MRDPSGAWVVWSLTAVSAVASTASHAAAATTDSSAAQPLAAAGAPVFTDLSSAPNGAMVTVYGSGFGSEPSVVLGNVPQKIVQYGDTKVVFTVSGPGGELKVGPRAAGKLPVHPGRVLEATPSRLRGTWGSVRPGDVVYLRAGEYTSLSGEGNYAMDSTLETFKRGTAEQPIALVSYPGETAVLRGQPPPAHAPIALGDGDRRTAAYLTFAGFTIIGENVCVSGGGNTSVPAGGPDESGASFIRVVGVRCEITNASDNTMSGMIGVQGDGWQLLGNTFVDPPNRKVINNNHAIYIQSGADDVEVAYNRLVNLHMGHVIQVHQDGVPKLYERIRIHDNLLQAESDRDMRGVNVGNVDNASTVAIERNTFRNLGQNFSAIAVYHGVVTVKDNRFYSVRAPNIDVSGQGGGTRKVVATGNRFEATSGYRAVEVENGASLDEVQLSGNSYCGVPSQESEALPCR